MSKLFDWIKKHLVCTWGVLSVFFAILVHIAFHNDAPYTWMIAKWAPGDILTYVGTVSLGLLAVWQNQQFKKENDASQERLERLTVQANEITAINKIIEIEADNLSRLRKAFDDFSSACSPQVLVAVYSEGSSSENSSMAMSSFMVNAEKHIDDSFFELTRELRSDIGLRNNDNHPLKLALSHYFHAAKIITDFFIKDSTKDYSKEFVVLSEARDEFISEREKYLINKENTLQQVIYGTLTLDEIKSLYRNGTV